MEVVVCGWKTRKTIPILESRGLRQLGGPMTMMITIITGADDENIQIRVESEGMDT